jgi:hypothetical protein
MHKREKDCPLLVWDVDDVLNDLTLRVLEVLGFSTIPTPVDLIPDPSKLIESLGIDHDYYIGALDHFRRTRFQELQPNHDVIKWLHSYGERFTCMALTSTPVEFFPVSAMWVMTHFNPWIDTIGCTPSKRPTDPLGMRYVTKGEHLQRLKVPYILIDDSAKNLTSVDPMSGKGMIFPTPWNSTQNTGLFLDQLLLECSRENHQ